MTIAVGRGAQLGRYVILDRVGEGGMGEVFAAYDPELDRRVAVKLLKPGRDDSRLVHEAQVLARLSHPNVIPVHDVGTHDGRVFLAMDYVDGVTLREWLRAARRPWREVLAVVARAGAGLAAAHAAGLVHRDFKPDNVLVRNDGHVFVTDFGVARATDAATRVDTPDPDHSPPEGSGAIVGTWSYMSPEQHRGAVADARSDQFAFAVTLYEALYGERPFAPATGELTTRTALAVDVLSGRVADAPRDSDVPPWLRQVVLRALAPRAELRYPSMTAFLEALARDPSGRRRQWAIGAAAAAVLVVGAAVTARTPETPRCTGGAARVAAAWGGGDAARVRGAFAATGRSYAADTADRAIALLDRRAAGWAAQHHETCAATTVRGERSPRLLDLGMVCLERNLAALRAVRDLFVAADVQVVDNAVRLVDGLDDPATCGDAEALLAGAAPPMDAPTASRAAAVRELLTRADVLRRAGKFNAGREPARIATQEARALGRPELLAEALTLLVSIARDSDGPKGMVALSEEAARAAAQAKDDRLLARALRELAWDLDAGESRHDAALAVSTAAEAAALRAGDERLVANALDVRGSALHNLGKPADSLAAYERALAIRERVEGPDSFAVARLLANMGPKVALAGRFADSRVMHERAIAIFRRELGPDHPYVALTLLNLGGVLQEDGKLREARECMLPALAIYERTLGPDHPKVAFALNNLGMVATALGEWAEARRLFERAVAIREKAVGPAHTLTLATLGNLAELERVAGNPETALVLAQRAVDRLRAQDANHPLMETLLGHVGAAQVALGRPDEALATYADIRRRIEADGKAEPNRMLRLLDGVGYAQLRLRRFGDARATFERAIALAGEIHEADNPVTAPFVIGLARCDLAERRIDAAVATAERALALAQKGDPGAVEVAEAKLVLAEALASRDPPRARALAEEAARAPATAEVKGEAERLLRGR